MQPVLLTHVTGSVCCYDTTFIPALCHWLSVIVTVCVLAVSSPITRGPIGVLQRQSIYRTYIYPEPPGGTGMSTVKSQDVSKSLSRVSDSPKTTGRT